MPSDHFSQLSSRLSLHFPESRLTDDPLRTLAYGRDASFYNLVPRLVVTVNNEDDVVHLLREAGAASTSVTFRAAGTSLSGQAVTDSVLCLLAPTWTRYRVLDSADRIALQPGIIGSRANAILAPYGRKIGPDPASINAAMIGGIAANNASGMCCGTAQNSYRTLSSMRLILADGTILDTGDRESTAAFRVSHAGMVARIDDLSRRVKANTALADRIRRKYAMKNTTGYSLNALVDYSDPVDVVQHLMIGSEGTLGFIAEITFRTVPELPHKASALMLFPDIATACSAVSRLKSQPVEAVELMDRASLRSVEGKKGMPGYLGSFDRDVASLLVETRAESGTELENKIGTVRESLSGLATVRPLEFTAVEAEYLALWDIRKGLFPSVGAMRRTGTTVIIEDVAFPVPRLAEATIDLQGLFKRHGYDDAIIFGHALEGNLHFVFSQDFNVPSEVDRYASFIEDVTSMVVRTYDGSLKAEHGTGRNMAPFVELEWGHEAYELMHEIKSIFDPSNLLNPGVILNSDSRVHLKNLKPLPEADPLIDKCIECGFCEVHCPSKNLTITPRQRIAVYREMVRQKALAGGARMAGLLEKAFAYDGNATCATDGLCATSCPVGIDTGKLIKELRSSERSGLADSVAWFLALHMAGVTASMRTGLSVVNGIHTLAGSGLMESATGLLRKLSGGRIPLWNRWMPGGGTKVVTSKPRTSDRTPVVYVPSCINRSMGPPRGAQSRLTVPGLVALLLDRAGYSVIYPENLSSFCCGMAFASKGFTEQGEMKAREMEEAVVHASNDGKYPILMDMSPCLFRMKETFTHPLKLYEPVEFAQRYLVDQLTFARVAEPVAVHSTCSARKMGLESSLLALAKRCADDVIVPEGIECCGWAGDRGFTVPELNASALGGLKEEIPAGCHRGYSTSRTCEIGLSLHSGIEYSSILYLVEECTRQSE